MKGINFGTNIHLWRRQILAGSGAKKDEDKGKRD
jgi:hypothetical protein